MWSKEQEAAAMREVEAARRKAKAALEEYADALLLKLGKVKKSRRIQRIAQQL